MGKIKRPFWLKVMIVLTAVLAFLSSLTVFVSENSQSELVAVIRSVFFVFAFMGLLINSFVARWATIAVMTLASIGGVVALVKTATSPTPPYLILVLGFAAVTIFALITFCFTFSKSVKFYYEEVRNNGGRGE